MPERELITHDDFYESKKQVERLTDAFERGMLLPEATTYLFQLKKQVAEFEKKHPYHQ